MKNKKNNIVRLDEFIRESLYSKKNGYYMSKNPFGKKGDFITSANISIFFSEMISIWIVSFWEKLKKPKRINIIDLGGGNGEMSLNILETLNKFENFKNFFNLYIHEKSPLLKREQQIKIKNKKVFWIDDLTKLKKGPCIFLANEFFDAQPIRQFLKSDKIWKERKVKLTKNNQFNFIDEKTNINFLEKKIGFKFSKNQNFLEISENTIKYLKLISKIITKNNGGLLIIDYGYFDEKMKNTLRGFYNHKIVNILNYYKTCDITYSLSFHFLKKLVMKNKLSISGMTTQGDFLKKLGIIERAEIVSKKLPFSKKANIFYRLDKLIGNKFMGEVFKVMLVTKKNIKFKLGF